MKKLYVIVRNDLDPGDQLAQAVHAATAFGHIHRDRLDAWISGTNNLVVLSIETEAKLACLRDYLRQFVDVVDVHEPDMGDELTAIACDDRAASSVSSLPLALRWRTLERKFSERAA